jgi:hypothetical protein
MYIQDSVRQILVDYKMTIFDKKVERRHRPVSYSPWNALDIKQDTAYIVENEIFTIFKVEIPEQELTAMADALCEMRDLMQDPETAKLLMEARFINRLKGNR